MQGHLFIVPGDITQLSADAIAYSTGTEFGRFGNLHPSFCQHVAGFAQAYHAIEQAHRNHCQVGDAYWIPLPSGHRPHGVVVVVAAGGSASPEEKAQRAVAAALEQAILHLRNQLGRDAQLLIALPAFRVGLGGDHHDRMRSARAQVATAKEVLQRHDKVDAAFVTYTPSLYQIFLAARRQIDGTLEDKQLSPLERSLVAGECVLFVGAGLSRGAGLPDWSELSHRLAHDLGLDPQATFDYLDLAQWHRERFGGEALSEVVRDIFADRTGQSKPTLAHYLLMGLPLRYVITTNYDDVLERALTALKRYPVKVVEQADVARTGQRDGVFVVKLHGDAHSPGEIVLSRDDYEAFFEKRPAMAMLLEGLLLNQTFFFVGYGLRDLNFRQIYSRIARILRESKRPAFATTFEAEGNAGELMRQQWSSKQLQLLPISGATLAEKEREFLRFLDRLADRVTTLGAARLFLAPDVEASPVLESLRRKLFDEVGREIEEACCGKWTEADVGAHVEQLAQVLEFLSSHGWQPRARGVELSYLWARLADLSQDRSTRRRLLVAALHSAQRYDDAQSARDKLRRLEGS